MNKKLDASFTMKKEAIFSYGLRDEAYDYYFKEKVHSGDNTIVEIKEIGKNKDTKYIVTSKTSISYKAINKHPEPKTEKEKIEYEIMQYKMKMKEKENA